MNCLDYYLAIGNSNGLSQCVCKFTPSVMKHLVRVHSYVGMLVSSLCFGLFFRFSLKSKYLLQVLGLQERVY